MNAVTRSKYGKRLPQNRTTDVQQARSLVHAASTCLGSHWFEALCGADHGMTM